jgi:hypothetical protein
MVINNPKMFCARTVAHAQFDNVLKAPLEFATIDITLSLSSMIDCGLGGSRNAQRAANGLVVLRTDRNVRYWPKADISQHFMLR